MLPPGYEIKKKRPFWKKKRYYLLAAVLVIIGVVIAAINKAVDEFTPDEKTAAFGTPTELDFGSGDKATVTVVPARVKRTVLVDKDKDLVGFQVTYVGVAGAVSINPLYWSVETAEGAEYDISIAAAEQEMSASKVRAGGRFTGLIAFEVPKGQAIAAVRVSDPVGQPVGTFTAGGGAPASSGSASSGSLASIDAVGVVKRQWGRCLKKVGITGPMAYVVSPDHATVQALPPKPVAGLKGSELGWTIAITGSKPVATPDAATRAAFTKAGCR